MTLLSVTDSNFFACASIASRRLAAAKTVTSAAAAGIAAAIDSASSVTKAATRNTAVLPQSDSTGQYTGVYNDTQTQKKPGLANRIDPDLIRECQDVREAEALHR